MESAEAFLTTDALYTAITSHRTELLDESKTRLKKLKQEGKLSTDAFESLAEIVEEARTGNWQAAAEELVGFIRNQPIHQHAH